MEVVPSGGVRVRDERIPELDALRGIAALAVAVYHYTARYDELYRHTPGLLGGWEHTHEVMSYGRYGVQLFFIISGFVILMSVSRAKSAGQFAVQRAARLYPAFWVACAATWLIVEWCGLKGRQVSGAVLGLNLTMAPMWFKPVAPWVWYVDGAYWSLKEELLFYVVMGVVLLVGLRKHALWVVGGLAGLHLCGLWVSADTAASWAQAVGFKSASQLYDSVNLRWFCLFAIGMVLYETLKGAWKVRHWVVLAVAMMDVLLPLNKAKGYGQLVSDWPWMFEDRPGPSGWEHFFVVVTAAALVWVAARMRPAVLRWRPLVWLGAISYSFYLLHQNIGYVVIRECEARGVDANVAVVVALCVVAGLASGLTFGVERPVYSLVKGWMKGRAGAGGGVGAR